MKLVHLIWNPQQKRLRALLRLFIFFLLLVILNIFLSLIINRLVYDLLTRESFIFNAFIMLLSTLPAFLLSARFLDRRKLADYGLSCSAKWRKQFLFGLGLGALLMAFIFTSQWLFGWLRVSGLFVINPSLTIPSGNMVWGKLALKSVFFFFVVGLYEELIMRAYLFRNMFDLFNRQNFRMEIVIMLTVLLTSVIFGILHAANPHANLISTLNIILAGIFLSLGMIFTGNIAISIGLHISWNLFQGFVFGFPVSGVALPVSLFGIEVQGPIYITGGAFGPEAGLVGLAAMILGSIIVVHKIGKSVRYPV